MIDMIFDDDHDRDDQPFAYSANRNALPARGLATIEQVAAYILGVWPLPRNADRWRGLRLVVLQIKRAVRNGELVAVIDGEPVDLCEHRCRRERCNCPPPRPKKRTRIPVSAAIDWHTGNDLASAEAYAVGDGRRGDAWIDIEAAERRLGVSERHIRRLAAINGWRRFPLGKKRLVRLVDILRR